MLLTFNYPYLSVLKRRHYTTLDVAYLVYLFDLMSHITII